MDKLVSIVIPTYNSEQFIAQTIESVFEQTYRNIEVICVDNNSTDGTWAVLQNMKDKYPQLILGKEAKQNACAARNKGMEMSTGSWIQFLDSDDILLPKKIENQIAVLNGMPENTPFVVGTYIKKDVNKGEENEIKAYYKPWKGLIYNRLGQTSANLFNRAAIEEIGGWNDDLKSSQEYDLMFRLLRNNDRIARNFEPNTVVYARDGSITRSDVLGNQHRYLHLISRVIDYLFASRKEIYNEIDPEFFQKAFVRIRLSAINGYPDFEYFYDKIMPKEIELKDNPFTPKWFAAMSKIIGYKATEKIRNGLRGVKKIDTG